MDGERLVQLLSAKLTNLPLYDQGFVFRKMLQDSGLVELIEAGAEMRYDEWGDIPMSYGPAKHWDESLERFYTWLGEKGNKP